MNKKIYLSGFLILCVIGLIIVNERKNLSYDERNDSIESGQATSSISNDSKREFTDEELKKYHSEQNQPTTRNIVPTDVVTLIEKVENLTNDWEEIVKTNNIRLFHEKLGKYVSVINKHAANGLTFETFNRRSISKIIIDESTTAIIDKDPDSEKFTSIQIKDSQSNKVIASIGLYDTQTVKNMIDPQNRTGIEFWDNKKLKKYWEYPKNGAEYQLELSKDGEVKIQG